MIKTDTQFERTYKVLAEFTERLAKVQTIEDETAKQLAIASHEGMIKTLESELQRYQNAKHGRVQIPKRINSVVQLCPYLTDIRIALGWSQEDLGAQLGVSRQAVNKWEEHEYRSISVSQLAQIIHAMRLHTIINIQHNVVNIVRPSDEDSPKYYAAAAAAGE